MGRRKIRVNIRKHGFDLSDAEEVFSSPMFVALHDREDYGEDRWIGAGLLRSCIVVIVFTERPQEVIRVISMRKATRYEGLQFEKHLADRLRKDQRHER
jgi:uncharacterized protein